METTESRSDRPLISFILLAYNQERFIREAVEGAFAQTYSPLEIILSDDCSTDRTFEIMRDMVARYRGPHQIILNRNEKNLGIGQHVNRLMELARGELIVAAAGDDVSLPERTEKIFNAWDKAGGPITSVYSSYAPITEAGDPISAPPHLPKRPLNSIAARADATYLVPGCAHAWTREVFSIFGPLYWGVTAEDGPIAFRTWVFHEPIFIPEPLVLRRIHPGNASHVLRGTNHYQKWQDDYVRVLESLFRIHQQYVLDLMHPACAQRCSEAERNEARHAAIKRMEELVFKMRFTRAKGFRRWLVIRDYLTRSIPAWRIPLWLLCAIFPRLERLKMR